MTTPIVFLDTETTSLDTRLGDVVEVAWAVEDGPVNRLVFPHSLDHADPKALEINGYWARDLCTPSRAFTQLQQHLIQDLTGATVVAENYGFDLAMLNRKLGFEPWHYRKIELSSVAMTVFNLERPESMRDTTARLRDRGFDIPAGDHTAVADVECLRACYLALRALSDAGCSCGCGVPA